MKREICCHECANQWREAMNWNRGGDVPGMFPTFNQHGEGMRQVTGMVKEDVECMCDGCGKDLEVGSSATAVSIYSKGAPYFEWEAEYVEAGQPGEVHAGAAERSGPGCGGGQVAQGKARCVGRFP